MLFSLAEWQSKDLKGVRLEPADQRLAAELNDQRRVLITELRNGLRVQTRSWVGLLQFTNFTVRIEPKLSGGVAGLVQMLELTTGLGGLKRHSSQRLLEVERDAGLLDLLALLLADACDQVARRGLRATYVLQEEDLPVLRGRLLAAEQVRRHFGRVDRLACRYDDHLRDNLDNQVLTTALAYCRSRVRDAGVKARLHRLYYLFAAVSGTLTERPSAVRRRISYDRLNDYYRPAHTLAFILLEGLGIDDLLATADTRSFAFLLDMNALFERFIETYLGFLLRRPGWRVETQGVDRTAIVNAASGRSYSSIRPDILLHRAGLTLPVDAKYKRYDDKKVSSSDLYQLFMYAQVYGSRFAGAPRAVILYPSDVTARQETSITYRRRTTSLAQLTVWGVPLLEAIDELRQGRPGACGTGLLRWLDGEWQEDQKLMAEMT